mgnify:CR=1 FL=1
MTKVNPKILYDLIDRDYLPIVAPVGMDENCETYNINADDAACAIARAVGADKLVFLTDVEGLYKDFSDKSSFISRITASDAEALVSSGEIGGGMLPKLNNCTAAVKGGVNRVHILDGRIPHCLLWKFLQIMGSERRLSETMSRFKAVQSTFGTKCLRNGGNMGELMQQYIDEAEQDLLHTYNRYQVVLDRGDGVSLYDIEGKRYLDFVAGIAVFALGYHNAEYNDALKAQIDKVIHTSNYYYNVPAVEAARHLKKVPGWTACSSPTAVRKRSRARSRRRGNMLI